MKKLNTRELIILAITVTLALIFVVFQFVVKPMSQGSMDIDDQLRADHEQLVKANQLLAQKSAVEANYQNLVGMVGTIDSEDAQMPTIISKIESAGRDCNIHIGNIQPQKPETQKDVQFLSVELDIDGQWLDIVHFLYLLQKQPNLYFINELNLEKYSGMMDSLRGRIVVSRMFLINP